MFTLVLIWLGVFLRMTVCFFFTWVRLTFCLVRSKTLTGHVGLQDPLRADMINLANHSKCMTKSIYTTKINTHSQNSSSNPLGVPGIT